MLAHAAAALGALALSTTPPRVIDAHVHLTNFTAFTYSGWANASAGACPCAPPCACDWSVGDWRGASSSLSPAKFVFVEVDADLLYGLAEAAWVQSLADSGADGGRVGGIVAHAPPGFGTYAFSDKSMDALLGQLQTQVPLLRGVRSYTDWGDATQFSHLVNHTRLLAARGLTLDVCLGGAGGDAAATAQVHALAAAVPAVTVVLDHLGSPPVLGPPGAMDTWASSLTALAALPNVYVKVGGALQYFKPCLTCPAPLPTQAQVEPLVTAALEAFGWDRSLYEGNYFFSLWYAPSNLTMYAVWVEYLMGILAGLSPPPSPAQLDALFYGTAVAVYRVA